MYGPKRSEELIGEVMQEYKRDEIVLATKAAHNKMDGEEIIDNTPAIKKQAVDEALKRLQTDY